MKNFKVLLLGTFIVSSLCFSLVSKAAIYDGNQEYTVSFAGDSNAYITDSSTVNFVEFATLTYVDSDAQSTVNFTDYSRTAWMNAYDQSTVNAMSSGEIGWLQMYDSSTANIYSGNYSWINLFGNSTANIYGDFYTSIFQVGLDAQVNIFGQYLEYRDGRVFGQAANGNYFNFDLVIFDPTGNIQGYPTNVTLNSVPLPAPLVLFVSGLIVLLRSGFKKRQAFHYNKKGYTTITA
ncbi:MAG: hypothetical protein AAES65_05075 [Candidatus Thiodiazotropha sp. (ex. Lucinoma kazani)]